METVTFTQLPFAEGVPLPEVDPNNPLAITLYSAESFVLQPGQSRNVRCGIILDGLPDGVEAKVSGHPEQVLRNRLIVLNVLPVRAGEEVVVPVQNANVQLGDSRDLSVAKGQPIGSMCLPLVGEPYVSATAYESPQEPTPEEESTPVEGDLPNGETPVEEPVSTIVQPEPDMPPTGQETANNGPSDAEPDVSPVVVAASPDEGEPSLNN